MDVYVIKLLVCLVLTAIFGLFVAYYCFNISKDGYLFLPILLVSLYFFSFLCITGFIMGDLVFV